MAKNKDNSKEKSKVPFNVLRKGAVALALAGAMIASPLILSGCSAEEVDPSQLGATWYSGNQYSNEEGSIGDFYYDIDDCDIYQKTNAGWLFLSNIKGDKGARGSSWLTGAAVTGTGSSIIANVANARVGDLYLNNSGTNAGNLYKCIAESTWEFVTNINGTDGETPAAPKVEIKDGYWYINDQPTGVKAEGEDGEEPEITIIDGKWAIDGIPTSQDAQGEKGERGSLWLTGSLVTGTGSSIEQEVSDAKIGDLYLNNSGDNAGNLYRCKAENTWEFLININGEDGETPVVPEIKIQDGKWYVDGVEKGTAVGQDGTVVSIIDGEWALDGTKQGISVRGSIWTTGEGAPEVSTENIANDMYLDTKNNAIYQYNGTAWNLISSLKESEILENYYYTVNTEAELSDLIEKGAKCFKLGADITLTKKLTPTTDMNFDLNKHTLAYNGETSADRLEIHAQNEKPINIVFKNGTMNFTNENGASTIVIDTGCSIRLEDVHYTSNTTALYPRRDTTKVEVINSTIVAQYYAVATNATADENGVPLYAGIQIVLKDSELIATSEDFDNAGVMINVPGSLNVENCEITGDKQALIARGGDTVIKNSKLVCTGEFLKANPAYTYQPTQIDFNQYEFSSWGIGNNIPCGTIVVGNNSTAYQYVTNIELDSVELVSKRIATPRIVAIGNETPSGKEYIGVNVLMNDMQYDAEFMFTSILGDNLNIRTVVHNYEELEIVLGGMAEGFNIVPVFARDLANYNQEIYVEEYMFVKEELIPYLQDQNALNGYSIYFPIFDLMKSYQVTALTQEGVDYAFETLESYRVILEDNIYLTDAEKYAEYKTLVSQGRLVESEYGKVYLVQEVSTEEQLFTALTNVEKGVLDKVLLSSNITVNTYKCAVLYQNHQNCVETDEESGQRYNVIINSTLSASAGSEAELVEICRSIEYMGGYTIEVTLTENIQLTSNENNDVYQRAMMSGSIRILSGEQNYEVIPYFEEREVSTELELINCLQELQNGNYIRPKLIDNITLTSSENNNIYIQMSGAIITNGYTVTMFEGAGENPGTEPEEITYTQVGTRDDFINTIQNAPVGEMVYIELTADIQLESEEDNVIVTEFMRSEYAAVKLGPTDTEYNILPYFDESAVVEVSEIDDVLALVDGEDMATCASIYIRLTQDIIISAENQEILEPWYNAGKLIPVNMDEYRFIPESEL